jgi:hypothetical protein
MGRAGGPEEEVLLLLVEDPHEYVRRSALGSSSNWRAGDGATCTSDMGPS